MNKQLRNNIIKTICFCTLFLVLFLGCYKILSWKDTAGNYLNTLDTFYDLDKDKVDVIFLGSSHTYCSINTAKLWRDYGIVSFDAAISGQDMAGSYYALKEVLKTQHPKVVCLDLYGLTFHGYSIVGNLYRNVLPYHLSKNYFDAVVSLSENQDKEEILLKWPIIHTRYGELQKEDFVKRPYTYLGYSAEFHTENISWMDFGESIYISNEQSPIPEAEKKWLEKIIALTKEENIELCLMVAPFAAGEESHKIFNSAKKLADSEGVSFVNMIRQQATLQMDKEHDFIDNGHTNYWGAEKVSAYMGQYLKENFDLEDHRGQSGYDLWDADAKARDHELMVYQLQATGELGAYMEYLAGLDEEYTVVIATSGDFRNEEVPFGAYLEQFSVDNASFLEGGMWMISGNQVKKLCDTREYFDQIALKGADLTLMKGDQDYLFVNQVDYHKSDNGITILVYDSLLQKVSDAVGMDAAKGYQMSRL